MAEPRKGAKDRADDRSSAVIIIRVVPRSSRVAITQEASNTFKIRLTSPPVEGAANTQLVKILSEKLSIPARQIHWMSGETGRLKRFKIDGLALQDIAERLLDA